MDAEAPAVRTPGLEAFLAVILRNTWLSITGLAIAVAGDTLARSLEPAGLAVFVGLIVSAVGLLRSYRPERLGCLAGIVVFAVRIWSALVALFFSMDLIFIP